MPVKRLTEVCHHYDVIVLVDGAHAPGQLSVSIVDVDADFYTGKYLYFLSFLRDHHLIEFRLVYH